MKKVLFLLLAVLVAGSVTLADAAVVKKDPKATVAVQKKQTATKGLKKQTVSQTGKKKSMAVANAPAKKPTKAKRR